MPGRIDVIFELAGPNAGRTVVLDKDKQFVGGFWRTLVAHEYYEGLVNKLATGYNAHPVGTPALLLAKKAWLDRQAAKDGGPIRVQAGTSEHVPAGVQGDGLRVEPERHAQAPAAVSGNDGAKPSPVVEGPRVDSVSRGIEERAAGSGLPDGLLQSAAGAAPVTAAGDLARAIEALDPENPKHWVQNGANAGKPRVDVVAQASGIEGLTRADVEAARPGWNRDVAKASKSEVKPEEV